MPINTTSAFSYDKLDHTKKNTGHLMVTLDVPDRDFERTPLCAVLVLDVSGSMGEAMTDEKKSKIEGLRETAKCLVQQLSSQDEVAIITYASASEVILERIKVVDKDKIYAAINKLQPTSCTNIGAGLVDGFRQINRDFSGLKRVFLISDGLNNAGMDKGDIVRLVGNRKEYGQGISVSTFGIGISCDQELMADLAKVGEGNYYYIKDSTDMRETFARELGGTLACEAQNIEITIKPNNGNKVLRVLNDFTVDDIDGNAVIRAEDLYIGEKRHVLIEMEIDKVEHPKPRKTSIAHVEVAYHDVKKQKSMKMDDNVLVTFVKSDESDKDEKLEIKEQVAILGVAAASIEAVKLANAGQYDAAKSSYERAANMVFECANAGSVLCSSIQEDVKDQTGMWSYDTYSAGFGAERLSDASNLRKCRAAVGISAKMYSTSSVKRMMDSFEKSQSSGSISPGVQIPPVELPQDEQKKDEQKDSGFSKKRSGR